MCLVELGYAIGLWISALLLIPQMIRLYKIKDSQGLSIFTFGGNSLLQFCFLRYSYTNHDYFWMFGYMVGLLLSGAIAIMIFKYRRKPDFQIKS